jgi:trehalose 6-phosphate phosphatase
VHDARGLRAELQGAGDVVAAGRPGRGLHRRHRELSIAADRALADAVRALRHEPARTALLMDFDGTLADIVGSPDDARPREAVVAVLTALVPRYRTVGVVSGRPVDFLRAHLPVPGLALVGQYGLERWAGGVVEADPRAEPFVAAVADAAERAEEELPGVLVERKGRLAVTLHWRADGARAEAARSWADRVAATSGLTLYPTRMAVELRPPVGVDKGSAVAALAEGARVAMFAGDDHGDLAAFDALAAMARTHALDTAVRVAVRSPEEPAELVGRTDVAVQGPPGFVALLGELASGA